MLNTRFDATIDKIKAVVVANNAHQTINSEQLTKAEKETIQICDKLDKIKSHNNN